MGLDQVSVLHLRYFLAVAQAGSVAAAARLLGIAQPSLSQQIRQLEERVGAPLFQRSTRGMTLTDNGQQLAASSAEWLTALRSLSAAPAALRVGVPRGTNAYVLNTVRRHLQGDLTFVPCDSAEADRAVRQYRLDAAITRAPSAAVPDAGTSRVRLGRCRLGLLASERAVVPAASQGNAVCLSDLASTSLRLLWFDERRAPTHARRLLTDLRAAGWAPELTVLDPAGVTLTLEALRAAPDLVALRPRPDHIDDGLKWVAVHPAMYETFELVTPS